MYYYVKQRRTCCLTLKGVETIACKQALGVLKEAGYRDYSVQLIISRSHLTYSLTLVSS